MPSDVGNQKISLKYGAAGNSQEINRRFVDVKPIGIYDGGYLTISDSSHAAISPLVCEISGLDVGLVEHQVRVATTTTVTLAVSSALPFIILRWSYTGDTADFMELLAVAAGSIQAYDLIVGKCTFAGGGALQGFNYGDTTYPRSTPDVHTLFLKVEPTIDAELKVRVRAGRVQSSEETFLIADQKSSIFVAPLANSKVYLVYVDRLTGNVYIDSSGTEAVTPVAPSYGNKLVLAEVTLTSATTNITASMIKDVRDFIVNKIGFVLENRTADPLNPVTGQIWLRTDL